jgi:primosomal protein N' (replication factor Y) (superfamily II helicase)
MSVSRQSSLFEDEPAEWEIDARELRLVATVVLGEGATGEYDYLVPETLCDPDLHERYLQPGRRVRVPFGRSNRKVVGYCVTLGTQKVDPARLKSVADVVDTTSLLSPSMLRLTRWMADYYLASWGEVLEAVVPAGVRQLAGTRKVVLLSVPEDVREQLATLKLSPKQKQALEFLANSSRTLTMRQLAEGAGCTAAPIKQLLKKGLLEAREKRVDSGPFNIEEVTREQQLVLNPDQQRALEAIHAALEKSEAHGMVLHGVTGSGKTEVYLQAIDRVVSFGRQAIVLVPEISLTPQTVRRFRARFDRVAVLHSHLSNVERHREWQRISRGEVQVVIGARSAVFAPTPHLGLIVIDEEHESTFKQDSAPRYHARDVAWQRALAEKIPLILGSATPSLEAWQKAELGEFERLDLPSRVSNRPLPNVMTVDLRDPGPTRHTRGAISRPLHQAMVAALRDDGQVILLLNRRGFSTHIQCPACGYVAKCPHCEIPLTFHRQESVTRCHYCDYQSNPPTSCEDCKSQAIRFGGVGTQKLEEEVKAKFPQNSCERMDTDSMRGKGSHQRVLEAFRHGEVDILLGTQMIAKGLDFPNVTLVGVINADTALHLPDFRAGERTFQLVAQVAGRTGRGEKGGRVLVQTLSPDHLAIRAAVRHDFEMFAHEELVVRKLLHYPPYGSMIRLVVRGPAEETARAVAEQVAIGLREISDPKEVRVMGPAVAAIAKLRDQFRFQIQVQAATMPPLHDVVTRATAKLKLPDKVILAVDVDPWDML